MQHSSVSCYKNDIIVFRTAIVNHQRLTVKRVTPHGLKLGHESCTLLRRSIRVQTKECITRHSPRPVKRLGCASCISKEQAAVIQLPTGTTFDYISTVIFGAPEATCIFTKKSSRPINRIAVLAMNFSTNQFVTLEIAFPST